MTILALLFSLFSFATTVCASCIAADGSNATGATYSTTYHRERPTGIMARFANNETRPKGLIDCILYDNCDATTTMGDRR